MSSFAERRAWETTWYASGSARNGSSSGKGLKSEWADRGATTTVEMVLVTRTDLGDFGWRIDDEFATPHTSARSVPEPTIAGQNTAILVLLTADPFENPPNGVAPA